MGIELAEIFRRYGNAYRQKYAARMPSTHLKAMRAIEACRTEALGGQVYQCPDCGREQYSYHSCRNRHCPKCQNENAQRWLEKQEEFLLPAPYFLLTFTVPAGLNALIRSHQGQLYDLLFKTSAAATQQLALEPRWLGGAIGMIGVLHTWGRNLAYHPHLHYLVPAGALTDDQKTWRPVRHPFFLPVRVLSRIFRRNLQEALRGSSCYVRIPASVWQQEWVVHCEPVGSGVGALKYLAPYIFRVAISNNRILKVDKDCVTFRYRATETGAERLCTLGAEEFIHRFLQHVLPKGFVKVRYYGFFSPGCRNKLATLRQQFQDNPASLLFPAETSDTCLPANSMDAPTAYPRCPVCGCSMRPGPFLPPMEHSPP